MPKTTKAATAPAPKTLYPVKEAEQLAKRMEGSMQVLNHICLAEKKGNVSSGRVPALHVYHDEEQYFNPAANEIHIGSHGPIEYFQVEDEATYEMGLKFLMGHENEHVFSTANVPYQRGIIRGVQVVLEKIAVMEGINKRFRNEKDYEVFLQTELKAKGIYVSYKTLMQIVSHIFNSVEDGRIERIRSLRYPGFALQRRYFRGLEWAQDVEYVSYKELTTEQHLQLLVCVIHSLATKNLYPKGFLSMYGNTPVLDEVTNLMPYVAKAVLAGKTRRMADNVVKVVEQLAPYIYEIAKQNGQAEEFFKQLLQNLCKNMANAPIDPDKMHELSEREEGESSEEECPVFEGMSDLVLTVDDETYDKLQEQSNKSGGNGPKVMIRRKHPKQDQNNGEKQNGTPSGKDASEKKEETKSGSGNKESDDKSQGSQGQSENNSQSESQSNKGKRSGNNSESNTPQNSNTNESHVKNQSENGSRSSGLSGGTVEEVLEAMKEAAELCRDEAEKEISTINRASVVGARNSAKTCEDTAAPISSAEVKDICPRFKEYKREYKLDQPLPSVLMAKGKALRKKNERYFRSLSSPTVTNLNNGSVDPSLICGLTYGETNIFRKVGIDKKFDGCVYMLLDNSGSMSGVKRQEACKSAAVIEEGFKGLLPLKIVAFDYAGGVNHEIVKGWNESQKLNCCYNFSKHGRYGCGNDDNYDIQVATRELLARPERKKLLLVLSDGAPADKAATRQAIVDARKKGIHVVGIYFEQGSIGSDAQNFKEMYEKDYICCTLDELDAHLVKQFIKFSRS